MSSFLIIKDSVNEKDTTGGNGYSDKKMYEFLSSELTTVGYKVFSKKFAFQKQLPILSKIDNQTIDYIFIVVPERIKLSQLFDNMVLVKDDINKFLLSNNIDQSLVDKKVKLPYIIIFANKESIDVKPSKIPLFIEDIIQEGTNRNLILAKIAIIIKRHSIDRFNKYRIQKLINIFNNTQIIIIELDKNLNIIFLNKKCLEFFDLQPNSMINMSIFDLITQTEEQKKSLQHIFEYNLSNNNDTFRFEFIRAHSDIMINWLVEVKMTDGIVESIIMAGYEITKQLEVSNEVEKITTSLVSENKKLNEQIEDNKKVSEVYQKEMKLARKIQLGIIPRKFPTMPGAYITATYVPMDAVGGDFYDYFMFESSFGFILCDVCGHGIPAALVTSMTKVLSHNSSRRIFSPKDFTQTINNEINKLLIPGNFLTAVILHFDNINKTLKYTSGGHIPQILFKRKTKEIHLLQSNGPVVGIIPMAEYKETVVNNIESGDRIILFTDGITEAKNKRKELYGTKRLVESVKQHCDKELEDFRDSLLADIAQFSKGVDVDDDVSLIVIDFV